MATTAGRGSRVKRQAEAVAAEAVQVVRDQVEELARAGARQMLLAALEDEVNVYLGRGWYERRGDAGPPGNGRREFRGYRNGTTPRRLTLGSGMDCRRLKSYDFLTGPEGRAVHAKHHYFATAEDPAKWIGDKKPVGGEYAVPPEWIKTCPGDEPPPLIHRRRVRGVAALRRIDPVAGVVS